MKLISKDTVLNKLKQENPWWKDGQIPEFCRTWTPRPYLELLFPLIHLPEIRRAVVLMGPRRVGKTILIYHSIQKLIQQKIPPKHVCYISLDQPIYNGLGLEQLLLNYLELTSEEKSQKRTVFFDEIQYLPNWENHLKALIDSYPEIQFLVSGSAAAALKRKSTESGAGRFTDFLLPPLTFYEYLVLKGKDIEEDLLNTHKIEFKSLNIQFIEYLNYGGYPEVIFSQGMRNDATRFIKNDIIDKVLLRDLPSLYGIHNIQELNSLFTHLAYNTAHEISLDKLSENSGVSRNTIKKYIEYLEAAFLMRTIHRIDRQAKHFKRETHFKIYLTNPSIRSALFSPLQDQDPELGALVETGIFSQEFHSSKTPYYARWDKTQEGEIDFVTLNHQEKPASVVEIKWSDRYIERPQELKKLIQFCTEHNISRAIVTTKTQEKTIRFNNLNLEFIPASLYCYTIGKSIFTDKFVETLFKKI